MIYKILIVSLIAVLVYVSSNIIWVLSKEPWQRKSLKQGMLFSLIPMVLAFVVAFQFYWWIVQTKKMTIIITFCMGVWFIVSILSMNFKKSWKSTDFYMILVLSTIITMLAGFLLWNLI